MRVASFLLADHAEAVGGKLYVTGGAWDTLTTPTFPLLHPHLSVCIVLHVDWEETNRRFAVAVRMLDEDGRDLLPQRLGGDAEAGRPPGMRVGDHATLLMVFNLHNLRFESPGTYSFALEIDGAPLARAPLRLCQGRPRRPG